MQAFLALLADLLACKPPQPTAVLPPLAAALELWPGAISPLALPPGPAEAEAAAAAPAGSEQGGGSAATCGEGGAEGPPFAAFHAALQQLCALAEAEVATPPATPLSRQGAQQQQQHQEPGHEQQLLLLQDGLGEASLLQQRHPALAAAFLRHLGRRWWGWGPSEGDSTSTGPGPGGSSGGGSALARLQGALQSQVPEQTGGAATPVADAAAAIVPD